MKLVRTLCVLLSLLACMAVGAQERDAPVLIGNATVPRIDLITVQRLYTGRAVEVGGLPVTVVNAAPGSRLRERFMSDVMKQEEGRYVAYWTVRKHVGKGTPPRELKSVDEIIEFVQSTPGAVGYIPASDVRAGLNVVLKP
jgi:ABC-type phosphate transport system substrate-binding protein